MPIFSLLATKFKGGGPMNLLIIKAEVQVNNFLCRLAMAGVPFAYSVQQLIYRNLKKHLGAEK